MQWRALAVMGTLPLLAAIPISAAGAAGTANLQVLYGDDYQPGDLSRRTVTVQQGGDWHWRGLRGDHFLFADFIEPFATESRHYAEATARVSLAPLVGAVESGPLRDLLLVANVEDGDNLRSVLAGLGSTLALPGFQRFQLNLMWRDRHGLSGSTAQLYGAWLAERAWQGLHIQFTGFAEWVGSEGGRAPSVQGQPQLLLDVGRYAGRPRRLWVGVEYLYWHNRGGRRGLDERVPQIMVKAILP
ncbi:MAG TPA: hypothetical protein VFV27_04230 [Nevskiaceae bacterium]|nr:hypothetical protein [Nevskiaceae bacterium]